MHFFIDLRYLFPPLLNLILFLFLTSHGGKFYWDLQNVVAAILQYTVLNFLLLMLAVLFLLLLFLFTPIKLPLTAKPIRLRTGKFSALLALAILASIILQPLLFWVAYSFLIIISPGYKKLWSLFKHFFNWLRQNLQSFPTIFIVCFTQQNQVNSEPPLPQDLVVVIDE
ncbi:hypothetical protein ACOSP7_025386 [Xanthoceras sorbifolium]